MAAGSAGVASSVEAGASASAASNWLDSATNLKIHNYTLNNTNGLQSSDVKNPAHDTHSCVGSSELFSSSMTALNVGSEGISSFVVAVTEGCGASVILELRICQ